jgi:hypothetical protein
MKWIAIDRQPKFFGPILIQETAFSMWGAEAVTSFTPYLQGFLNLLMRGWIRANLC